ncbi:MAG: ECF transporter S component [Peptostreptococcaceae bacterium]|nr:ECF transporter S component [Peptostreptococcaceae bacterium]
MKTIDTKMLARTSVLTALVFITTFTITIPLGFGYFNMGDAAVFLTGLLLGPKYAFLAAGIGSGLADYSAGYLFYIPSTFILKGMMALLASKASEKSLGIKIAFMLTGGIIMILGYYVTEGVIYGNWIAPIYNLPWNALQFSLGMVIALILHKQLKRFIS